VWLKPYYVDIFSTSFQNHSLKTSIEYAHLNAKSGYQILLQIIHADEHDVWAVRLED
jgi:hypothetical protein